MKCTVCHGTRHIPEGRVMRRCPHCFNPTFDERFIAKGIRGHARRYPEELDQIPPWSVEDTHFVGGDLTRFKNMVWRSLAEHRFTGLTYEYVTLTHAFEVFMDRDTKLTRQMIFDTPLLVFTFGNETVTKNDYYRVVLATILYERPERGRASWVHTTCSLGLLAERYGSDVRKLIPSLEKTAY